jgi:hypothetical protein
MVKITLKNKLNPFNPCLRDNEPVQSACEIKLQHQYVKIVMNLDADYTDLQ